MVLPYPRLETERSSVLLPGPDYAGRMLDYYRENEAHLKAWEPQRSADFWTVTWWQRQLEFNQREFREGLGARMVVVLRDDPAGGVAGVVNLSNIVRGPFQACYLGYSIARRHEGAGLMREALEAVLEYAFHGLGLHRVMANYQPRNARSGRLLERLGFVREGYARDYLHIDGEWRDHVLTARLHPGWED